MNANLIHCFVPIILTLILLNYFSKVLKLKSTEFNLLVHYFKYSIITWTYSLMEMIFIQEKFAFEQLVLINWHCGLCSYLLLILPFTLFIKKIASNFLLCNVCRNIYEN
jgi:hypothetical protein